MRPLALTTRNRFLFIVGHMRSGSSLLSHLLCSSDDVIGFGEAHQNYRRRSDLAKLMMCVRRYTGKNPLRYRYVLDKIVASHHEMSAAVLADRRTRYVFLVREPLASVASIVAMHRQYRDETFHQLIAFATDHYAERMAQLVDLARTIDDPERCLLLTHHELLAETPAVFEALEKFLELSAPLREDYKILPTTGQPGIGDPSPNILRGKIDRSLPRNYVAMSPQLQVRMAQCYENCVNILSELMPTPAPQSARGKKRAA
jgi:hypothetical protein